jgi:hypothetical protein
MGIGRARLGRGPRLSIRKEIILLDTWSTQYGSLGLWVIVRECDIYFVSGVF